MCSEVNVPTVVHDIGRQEADSGASMRDVVPSEERLKVSARFALTENWRRLAVATSSGLGVEKMTICCSLKTSELRS